MRRSGAAAQHFIELLQKTKKVKFGHFLFF
jgi:hypothetical protein